MSGVVRKRGKSNICGDPRRKKCLSSNALPALALVIDPAVEFPVRNEAEAGAAAVGLDPGGALQTGAGFSRGDNVLEVGGEVDAGSALGGPRVLEAEEVGVGPEVDQLGRGAGLEDLGDLCHRLGGGGGQGRSGEEGGKDGGEGELHFGLFVWGFGLGSKRSEKGFFFFFLSVDKSGSDD